MHLKDRKGFHPLVMPREGSLGQMRARSRVEFTGTKCLPFCWKGSLTASSKQMIDGGVLSALIVRRNGPHLSARH